MTNNITITSTPEQKARLNNCSSGKAAFQFQCCCYTISTAVKVIDVVTDLSFVLNTLRGWHGTCSSADTDCANTLSQVTSLTRPGAKASNALGNANAALFQFTYGLHSSTTIFQAIEAPPISMLR